MTSRDAVDADAAAGVSAAVRFLLAGLGFTGCGGSSTKPPWLPDWSTFSNVFFRRSGHDLKAATDRTRRLFAAELRSYGFVVTTNVSSSSFFFPGWPDMLPPCRSLSAHCYNDDGVAQNLTTSHMSCRVQGSTRDYRRFRTDHESLVRLWEAHPLLACAPKDRPWV
jgi:hypothetical protein